jgi:hypothetical protein
VGADDRSASISGLVNGKAYEVSVVAWSARGTGTPSEPKVTTPKAGVARPPAAPGYATSVTSGATTTVWWGAPADEGDRAIVGYCIVAVRAGQVLSWTNASATARSATVPTPPGDAVLVVWASTGAGGGVPLQVAPVLPAL